MDRFEIGCCLFDGWMFFVQSFIKGAWGYYSSPIGDFLFEQFSPNFELRDLILTYSKKDSISKRSDCTKLARFQGKNSNSSKAFIDLPYDGKYIIFRFIIEYGSLRDFYWPLHNYRSIFI
jgi:hypothetical protein